MENCRGKRKREINRHRRRRRRRRRRRGGSRLRRGREGGEAFRSTTKEASSLSLKIL